MIFKNPAAKALDAVSDARSAYLRVTVEPTPGNVRKLRAALRKAAKAAARVADRPVRGGFPDPDARGLRNNLMTAETDAAGLEGFARIEPLWASCLESVDRCTDNARWFALRIPGACG